MLSHSNNSFEGICYLVGTIATLLVNLQKHLYVYIQYTPGTTSG